MGHTTAVSRTQKVCAKGGNMGGKVTLCICAGCHAYDRGSNPGAGTICAVNGRYY